MTPMNRPPPETCPACGADVPRTARACPECGSDYETGWNEEATAADGLDLPDSEFDYDDFVRREFGAPDGAGPKRQWLPALIAGLVSAALILAWVLFR